MNRLSFGARSLFLLSVVLLAGACGGDPEERTPAEPDASADATRIDSGRDAMVPPPPPPEDSGTPPDDGATRPDEGTVPPDDASTPPDDAGPGSCRSDADCMGGEVCSFAGLSCADRPIGRCGPAGCTPDVTTMCLCDGRTFEGSSSCPPAPVAHFGACETTGTLCGTRGAPPCAINEYCDFVDGTCGRADEGGTCLVRPDDCDAVLDPVCGCDGTTYNNECEAATHGVDVATTGPCDTTTRSCLDTPCEGGLTCVGGPTCGDRWSCAALGRLCTDDLVPYCGCNGVTFEDSSTCPRLAYAWMGTCDRPTGLVSCDSAVVSCERVEPTCPDGQAPSVRGSCWGPCVPIEQCSCLPGEIRNTCPAGSTGCGAEGHCLR